MVEFETFTDDLIKLRNWLLEKECPIVAMESTGPYWTPIHNILEGYFQVILVNPNPTTRLIDFLFAIPFNACHTT